MKWRLTRWFLAGFAAAVAAGAIGTLIGVRRNVMIADEEATISLPIEEDAPVPARRPVRPIGPASRADRPWVQGANGATVSVTDLPFSSVKGRESSCSPVDVRHRSFSR